MTGSIHRGLWIALTAWLGCVEPSHGSRLVIDLFSGFGPASTLDGVGTLVNPHYVMWATIRDQSVVRLLTFDVVPIVDPRSPCLMFDETAEESYPGIFHAGELVMAPPAPDAPEEVRASKQWVQARVRDLSTSIFAVTSASDGFEGRTEMDLSRCDGSVCWLDHVAIVAGSLQLARDNTVVQPDDCDDGEAPATPALGHYCIESASGRVTLNVADRSGVWLARYRAHIISPTPQRDPMLWSTADRLAACRRPHDKSSVGYDPNFYIANSLQLTNPLMGRYYGVVDSLDPTASYPVGGASFAVPFALDEATHLFATVEDHNVGSPDANIGNLIDDAMRGPIVLFGAIEHSRRGERRVDHADLLAPSTVTFRGGRVPGAHAAIYVNLDETGGSF